MSEPTEPTTPRPPQGAGQPPQDPAGQGAPTSAVPAVPTQPLPAVSEAQGAGPAGPGPAGPGPAGPGPAGPGPAGPGPAGPGGPGIPGAPAAYAAGGPPPKRPGLWRQATSTTGGTIAVIVAGCLVALMLLGVVGVAGLVAVRAIRHDDGTRIEKVRDGALPPGQQRKLDRLPQGPGAPGGRNGMGRNGMGGGMGGGQGGGLGPLMGGAMGLGNVQHGEFTVDQNGTPTVMTFQRGAVTKVSASSITVKSTDNFTATYAIGADTRGQTTTLQTGDTVLVVAQKTGAKAVIIAGTRRG